MQCALACHNGSMQVTTPNMKKYLKQIAQDEAISIICAMHFAGRSVGVNVVVVVIKKLHRFKTLFMSNINSVPIVGQLTEKRQTKMINIE